MTRVTACIQCAVEFGVGPDGPVERCPNCDAPLTEAVREAPPRRKNTNNRVPLMAPLMDPQQARTYLLFVARTIVKAAERNP